MKKIIFILSCLFLFTPLFASAQEVNLIWQGQSYTPPFYKAKSLWANQTKVTFLAISQGLGDPTKLAYRWSRNGTVQGDLSGVGKNTYTFSDDILSQGQDVKVEVLTVDRYDEPVLASQTVQVTPTSPQILVYENNPLYGFLFNKEVGGQYTLQASEVTFDTFPLFFGTKNRNDSLTYAWHTNTGATETSNSVTYRTPEGTTGTAQVGLTINHTKLLLQTARKDFLVQFEK